MIPTIKVVIDMKRFLICFILVALVGGSVSFAKTTMTGVKKEEKFQKHLVIESPSGINARFFKFSGEGNGKTFIEKDEIIITTLDHAQPISWHPRKDILVVKEYSADDDNRCYILNIGAGEYNKKGKKRKNYIMGSRYVNRVKWSKDGTKVTLYSTFTEDEDTYEIAKYTIIVEEPEEKKDKKKEKDRKE